MAVSIAFYSVVVRNATIASCFPGGMAAYQSGCPNQTWSTDQLISRVGFMAFDDVEAFILYLEQSGVPRVEIAVTRQGHGLVEPCDWLATGEFERHSIAWLAGTQPETLFIPESDMDAPQAQPVHREELEATHEYLGVINRVETFRHRGTGEMVFVGRPAPPPPIFPRRRWWWPFRR